MLRIDSIQRPAIGVARCIELPILMMKRLICKSSTDVDLLTSCIPLPTPPLLLAKNAAITAIANSFQTEKESPPESNQCKDLGVTPGVTTGPLQGVSHIDYGTGCTPVVRTAEETREQTIGTDQGTRPYGAAVPPSHRCDKFVRKPEAGVAVVTPHLLDSTDGERPNPPSDRQPTSAASSTTGLVGSTGFEVPPLGDHFQAAQNFRLQAFPDAVRARQGSQSLETVRPSPPAAVFPLKVGSYDPRLTVPPAVRANPSPEAVPDSARSTPPAPYFPTLNLQSGVQSGVLADASLTPIEDSPSRLTGSMKTMQGNAGSGKSLTSASRSKDKGGAALLTAFARQLATKSHNHMIAFLLFGKEGVDAVEAGMGIEEIKRSSLNPSKTSWRPFLEFDDNGRIRTDGSGVPSGIETWSIPAIGGYFWQCVSSYMNGRGLPIDHPADFGRILGTLARLVAGSSKREVFERMWSIMTNYDEIMAVKNIFDSLPSDGVLDNRLVIEAHVQWKAMDNMQRYELRERIASRRNVA